MNLRHLRTFVQITEAGGVARAAGRLHLSQPTVSRQIRALEDALGLPLFDRVGRNVQLTSDGEDLLRRSRQLLADADAIGERARALKGGDTGVLRVGATPQLIESLLVNVIAQHRRRHPGGEIHPVEDGGTRRLRRVDRSDLHLAVTTEHGELCRTVMCAPGYLVA